MKFSKKIPKKIWQFHKKSLPLHRISEITQLKHFKKKFWRDGRVVDCIGLENRRTERYRGFESLSLRKELNQEIGWVLFLFGSMNDFVIPPNTTKLVLNILIYLRTNYLPRTNKFTKYLKPMQNHHSVHTIGEWWQTLGYWWIFVSKM